MSGQFFTGFSVGPTSTDFTNAAMYATDVINKEVCESRPDIYTWEPSNITRYPCPEGLECSTGTCKFTEDACKSQSEMPFHDCVRKTVTCDTTPTGLCEICDYSIKKGRNIVGPYTDDSAPEGCWAGDVKYEQYVPYPVPLEAPLALDETSGNDAAPCDNDAMCQNGSVCVVDEEDVAAWGRCVVPCTAYTDCTPFDTKATCGTSEHGTALDGRCFVPNPPPPPTACPLQRLDIPPYTVLQYDMSDEGVAYAEANPDDPLPTVVAPVPCVTDDECYTSPGVGGVCGRDPDLVSYGFCYDPNAPPYLEWRDEMELWDGMSSRNVCLETLPYMRQWCEMPWTRQGANLDDPTVPLPLRVKGAWKSKARPPFWYDDHDGSCYVTKTYCEANLKNGGFSAGYGRSTDWYLGSTCSASSDKEVTGAYDCCTKLGDSIGEFFLGRTLTTDLRELVEGDPEGFGYRWKNYMKRGFELVKPGICPEGAPVDACNIPDGVVESGELYRDALQEVNPSLVEALDFVSDPRLKSNLRLHAPAVLGRGVHAYTWTWDETATRLYGLAGEACGLLTSEVRARWPHAVVRDGHGYDHLHVVPGDVTADDEMLATVLQSVGAVPWRVLRLTSPLPS